MTSRVLASVAALVTIVAIGCNKNEQSMATSASAPQGAPAAATSPASPATTADSDLVRQAVEDHVRNNKGINMSAFDMTVDSVTVDGDHAQANTTFKVKGGGAAMEMVYSLERHANGWLVLKSQPANGQFVHPPMDKIHSGAAGPSTPPTSQTPNVTDFLKNQPPDRSK